MEVGIEGSVFAGADAGGGRIVVGKSYGIDSLSNGSVVSEDISAIVADVLG